MKVLFVSYNTCCQNTSGGVQVRIRKIHDLLISNGIQVDYFSPFETRIEEYDVLHVFRLDYESYNLILCAKNKGLRIVLSSIISINNAMKVDVYRMLDKLPFNTIYSQMFRIIEMCDIIIAETPKEAEFLIKHYGAKASIVKVLPNGVDIPEEADDSIFELIGGYKKFILQVGRFDSNKNQINVIKALCETDIDVVFIGGPSHSDGTDYYEECVDLASKYNHFHFLGWLKANSPVITSAFKNAQGLILPSYSETFGLVAIEASIYGTNVLLSNTLPINDFNVYDRNLTFSPSNVAGIKGVVNKVMSMPQHSEVLKKKTIEVFSWSPIIKAHIECYNL